MGTFANIDSPDEMALNVAFHQGLHCSLCQNQSSETEIQYYVQAIITRDPQNIQKIILTVL